MAEEKHSNGEKDESNSEFDNFQRLLEGTLSVPKEELDRRQAEYERKREQEKK